jgi:hypothetical protein
LPGRAEREGINARPEELRQQKAGIFHQKP